MITRTIVGYTDTPGGRDALAMGAALASTPPNAELVVATTYAYNPPAIDHEPRGWRKDLRDRAARTLETAREVLPAGVNATLQVACGLSTADGLHRLASEIDADAIVVGVSHEHGLSRIVHGSVTEQTLSGAPCAVAVAPNGTAANWGRAFRRIVVAHNGSPEAERALLAAADLARAADATIDIVGVCDEVAVWYGAYLGPDVQAELTASVRDQLEEARGRFDDLEGISIHVLHGNPAHVLRKHAADADLLVLGSRNHGPLARTMLGSVSSPLIRKPPCPLIVLPRTTVTADHDATEQTAQEVVRT